MADALSGPPWVELRQWDDRTGGGRLGACRVGALAVLGRGGGAPVEATPWLGGRRGGRHRRGGVRVGLEASLALRAPQLPSRLVVLDAREPACPVPAERRR